MNLEHNLDLQDLPKAELTLARSDFLDAFADIEASVCKLLHLAGQTFPKGPSFGSKLEAFKKVEAMSQIAKANLGKRDRLATDLAKLLPVRADIVHSRIRTCMIDSEPAAVFTNSQDQFDDYAPCRVLTKADFARLSAELRRITKALGELGRVTSPASSPPPPLPDAAGGP